MEPNESQNSMNSQPGPSPAGMPAAPDTGARITELEKTLTARAEELGRASARIAELEKTLSEAGTRITGLEKQLTEAGAQNTGLTESLAKSHESLEKIEGDLKQAVASYRTLMVSANPEVLPELIAGDTIESLDGSLTKARELIGKVKSGLEARARETRVPAGAPARGNVDTRGLSPRDKIKEGVERSRGD